MMNGFRSRLVLAGALVAVVLAVAACGSSGAQPTSPVVVDPNAVKIAASGQQFTTKAVTAPAGKAFQIAFENQTGDPHNIAIAAAGAEPAFRSEVYTGPGTKTFDVQPLAAGTYTFKCDVHPGMEGTLTVQ